MGDPLAERPGGERSEAIVGRHFSERVYVPWERAIR